MSAELTDTQKAYNVAQSEMFQLAAYGHHRYHPLQECLTDEGKRQQRDYNDRITAAQEQLGAAVLRLVAEKAETFRGNWGVVAAWLRSLADDPAAVSLLACEPDEDEDAAPVEKESAVAAYRSPGTRQLYCVTCARQEAGWQPVTEVRDDAACDFCGGRILAIASRTLGEVVAHYAAEGQPAAPTDAERAAAVAEILRHTAGLVDQVDLPQTAEDTADFCDGARWATAEMRRIADAVTFEDPEWRPDGMIEMAQRFGLTDAERAMLRYALEVVEDKMASECDEFTDDEDTAVTSLKRLAGEG